MSWYWIIVALTVGILVVGYYTDSFRFVQTLYLIVRATPYEQAGAGGGRILIIGDSTGYGTGAAKSQESVAGRIGQDYPDYEIVNRSVNGDTVADALARLQDPVGTFDLIILQLGGNDILQKVPLTDTIDSLTRLAVRLQPYTNHMVMLSAGNVGATPMYTGAEAEAFTTISRDYHAALADFAAARDNFTYVSLFDEPSDDPFLDDPARYVASDGLHPSGAGYGVWYDKLSGPLRALLKPAF